jgi:hypothetical protein
MEKSFFLSMGEEPQEVDCNLCEGEFLKKILTSNMPNRKINSENSTTAKSRIEKFIEDSREDLQSQRQALQGRSSDD